MGRSPDGPYPMMLVTVSASGWEKGLCDVSTVGLRAVSKVFGDGTVGVDRVSLDVGAGEVMVLLGPSGGGKSTILRMIAGLEEASSGTILLDGEAADELTPRERGVAMVCQDFALYPHMSVADNVGFPLKVTGVD